MTCRYSVAWSQDFFLIHTPSGLDNMRVNNRQACLYGWMHNPAASSHRPAYLPIPGVKGLLCLAAMTPQPALDPWLQADIVKHHQPLQIEKKAFPCGQFFELHMMAMTHADEVPKTPRTDSDGQKPVNRYASRRRLYLLK